VPLRTTTTMPAKFTGYSPHIALGLRYHGAVVS
jgi:hypothetical protein